ncbi:acriflavin resistance family protein (AcrB/AcrD/AcrF family protein) [Desulforapulum autotrophicum HRM2]|uniref:Acriflavin resistance family protein (AcrB/AcrD/AcrF family protein) n=1 Tax=Desulforapulum autotrophicum (strain ATCC 43914 / DSM 3382 / VKM B-1955 / HRM2) TaxID=177437 RepID=C0QDU4_DESAH|nr:efflux RND transporter permease subunit [Desulforapulum autotrophicum]ACN17365.1 acriflavin resistance family protein (AcrB/AcrD/AcrF family protein) [Desulforapulum autotrophicum HRM2]
MSLPQFSLKYPYLVLALVLVVVVMGTIAYVVVPTDLFPESVPPQVAVITVLPGASADDMADKVTRTIEKELGSLSGLKRISSVSRDGVSAITVEFLFSKPMGEAVTDVDNAVARVRSLLPQDVQEPLLYRITDATRPLMTLALTPKPASFKALADIRLLAENDLRDDFMAVAGVGDVQVFGGHQREIEVRVDQDRLAGYGMTLVDVITGLARQNVASPGGIVYGTGQEYLLKVSGELTGLQALENLPLGNGSGRQILLKDVARTRAGESDLRSRYHGNGREAVAVNLLRPEKGDTVKTLVGIKKALVHIRADYPDILFETTEDQQPLIDLNVHGMRSSLWQAVFLTILLIFVFLADLRAAAVVSVAIPLSFLAALIVLWISPYTLNMVTLSGLIVAVGMVVDGSVVVLENIHRHHRDTGYADAPKAALDGAAQVALPITAGMLTTVAVLVPVIFTTGYTGRTMRPLNITIVSTLIASLVVSLSVIPILAARFFARTPDRVPGKGAVFVQSLLSPVEKGVEALTRGYEGLVALALKYRILTALILLVFMVFSLRVVKPLLGGEQMPPMDTGIVIVEFDTQTWEKPEAVNRILDQIEAVVRGEPAVVSVSSLLGSEPGVMSFGGGKATAQSGKMTVYLTPRTQRTETIWDIEAKWRRALSVMPGVRTFRIAEYGATPVATTKAPFNAILSGPDSRVLSGLADNVLALLHGSPGLVDLGRSWYLDKNEQKITVDPELAAFYGTSPLGVAAALRMAVQGVPATAMRVDGFSDIPVRVRLQADQVDDLNRLGEILVQTPSGRVRLASLATITTLQTQPFITRENQRTTIDITAGNAGLTIAQANGAAKQRLAGLSLPKGYTLDFGGTARDMAETQASLGHALVIGIALLFILLMAMFKSVIHPVTIILSIPLAAAGGLWGLLIFDKPFCMPALMGFILLGGTIVNNAILMLDFIIKARAEGLAKDEAIVQSVRLRLRPILITAVSTIVGFSPLIFETAVGLERMSPLGIAAASGLLVGTIVTMVAVPVIYSLLDSLKLRMAKILSGKLANPGTTVVLIVAGLTACLTVSLWSVPAGLEAAEVALGATLSLDQAVAVALAHNPDLEESRAVIALDQGRVGEAGSTKGLHLDLTGQGVWSEMPHAQISGLSSADQGFARLNYQGVLSASWLVTDFGNTEARLRAAMNRHRAGISMARRREQEVVFHVSMQFLQAMTFTDLVVATSVSQESLQAFARSVDLQIQQGKAPEVDALKIDVRLAEIETRLAELERSLSVSRAALGRLMGVEEVLPPLTVWEDAENEVLEGESIKTPVLRDRMDVQAGELLVQAGRDGVLASQRRFMPRVELFATGGLYGANDPETGTGQVDNDPWKDDFSGGVRILVPLLDNGLRKGGLAVSRAELDKARADLRARRLAVIEEIAVAKAGVKSARVKIKATRKTVAHAGKVVEIERLKYSIGRGSSADVLDAEAALLNAESLARQAVREFSLACLAERLALGERN